MHCLPINNEKAFFSNVDGPQLSLNCDTTCHYCDSCNFIGKLTWPSHVIFVALLRTSSPTAKYEDLLIFCSIEVEIDLLSLVLKPYICI